MRNGRPTHALTPRVPRQRRPSASRGSQWTTSRAPSDEACGDMNTSLPLEFPDLTRGRWQDKRDPTKVDA